MSDQESSSQPPPKVRKKIKKTEDTIIRNILKLLHELKNEHRTPFILSFPSKYGQLHFGSTHAVATLKAAFEDEAEWKEAFKEDQDEIIEGFQLDVEDDDIDDYNHARGTMAAQKLPADLPLMIYVELWSWITQEIMKEHWLKDGQMKCVKWGDSSFEPSFWLGDVWPWHQVRKHYKDLPKSSYTGPGIMSDFLKRVVEHRLRMLGIDHENWVSMAFTDEQRIHRQKHQIKKKAVPSTIERDDKEEEYMDDLNNMDEDDCQNAPDGDDSNSNVNNSEAPSTSSTSDSIYPEEGPLSDKQKNVQEENIKLHLIHFHLDPLFLLLLYPQSSQHHHQLGHRHHPLQQQQAHHLLQQKDKLKLLLFREGGLFQRQLQGVATSDHG